MSQLMLISRPMHYLSARGDAFLTPSRWGELKEKGNGHRIGTMLGVVRVVFYCLMFFSCFNSFVLLTS